MFVTDGGWTSWSEWNTCTLTCGGGNQTRTRTCTNPTPQNNGNDCGSEDFETQACNDESCPVGKRVYYKN
jgi:hypothetical protein